MNGKDSRWTKQFKMILDIIYESDRPVSADEAYKIARKKLPNISLGTVYRNLNKLVSEGLVSEVQSNGITAFSRHPFPSAHFECSTCHKLVTVPVELNVLELSHKCGMAIDRWSLHLIGTCSECAKKCI
jgi:Fe2+ or Zn2+ uptake regulation protein